MLLLLSSIAHFLLNSILFNSGHIQPYNMSDGSGQIDFQLYRYTPNLAAAAIFIVLFTLTTIYHTYQLIKTRAWYFIAFVLGGICESNSKRTNIYSESNS